MAGSSGFGYGPSTTRGRRTRAALVAAARDAFEEFGFRNARISDIGERAGTSYGVVYHYFDSKESIIGELFTSVTGHRSPVTGWPPPGIRCQCFTAESTEVTYADMGAGGVPAILATPFSAASDRVII